MAQFGSKVNRASDLAGCGGGALNREKAETFIVSGVAYVMRDRNARIVIDDPLKEALDTAGTVDQTTGHGVNAWRTNVEAGRNND